MFRLPAFAFLLLAPTTSLAADSRYDVAPANSELAVDESFDTELSTKWHVNTGQWEATDGVLHAKQIEADNHSAAARRSIETTNAVYQLRFRFTEGGKGFHFGFDPAKGELDKRGHLFSIMATPKGWKIQKHVDKNRPQEDPNEVLAKSSQAIPVGEWTTLRVSTWGPYVSATLGDDKLTATHPTFAVRKPTLVFRALGDGVEIDDVKVWRQVR